MLLEQLKSEKEFTSHEKDVARYMFRKFREDPGNVCRGSGKRAFTSKTTVVRLGQKLGLSGYRKFRMKLIAKISQKNRIDRLLENEPITGEVRIKRVLRSFRFSMIRQ